MAEDGGAGAPVGRFCWPEANVKDPAAAKAFYAALFGWGVRQDADGFYAEWQVAGRAHGGLMALGPQREEIGIPSHWTAYVAVESADDTAAKVKENGGLVLHGPFSMEGVGRFAVVQDPTGAAFSLYQAAGPRGESPPSGPGTMCWNELMTRDPGKAGAFYSAVFGWTRQVMPMGPPVGDYVIFQHGGGMAAGMMDMSGPMFAEVPPHWLVYFAVEDCDGMAAKAAELGAAICAPPTDIPGVGRFSVIRDPQGAVFAILRFAG